MNCPQRLEQPTRPDEPTLHAASSERRAVSVVVADRQALFRTGLVRILQDDQRFDVVAEAARGAEVTEALARKPIDVVVTDADLGAEDGVELAARIAEDYPATRVLILAAAVDARLLLSLKAGAAGFVSKDAQPEAIRSAIVAANLGNQVLSQEATRWLVDAAVGRQVGDQRLTAREAEVARLVSDGKANREIAARLDISEKTVRNYVSRVYHKLSLDPRAQISSRELRRTYSGVVH
jgi:DNA-binding NarL/FixJ family response regulator